RLRTAAVLCRRRSQFPGVVEALRAAGFEPEVVGLGGLLDTPEVADLVAALQVAHDPTRGDSLMRLLTGSWLRLGASDVLALGEWSRVLGARTGPSRSHRRDGDAEASATSESAEAPAPPVTPDLIDEGSLVDALDELPPPGWTGPAGRSLSDAGRHRLQRLADVLGAIRGLTYLPVPELMLAAERLLGLDIELMARPG